MEPKLEKTLSAEFAEVIVSIAHTEVDRIFHYAVPESIRNEISAGRRVMVPFGKGNKNIEGYVIGFSKPEINVSRIKNISHLLDEYPAVTPVMLKLAQWMREKYYTTLSVCLRCVAPVGLSSVGALKKKRKTVYAAANIENPDFDELSRTVKKKGGVQARVLEYLEENGSMPVPQITRELGISSAPVSTLRKNGLLRFDELEEMRNVVRMELYGSSPELVLTPEQYIAVDTLLEYLRQPEKKPVLIHGVTGSGKTEIYLRLIEETLNTGKQAIMLVPEISLTPQAVETFTVRFGDKVTVTHSRLTSAERLDQWRKAREGGVSVIIGPRSALFTPFNNLGVIIIDEEHERTYMSESPPKYSVGEVAEKLSELTGALVVMGSATPGVETYLRAKEGGIGLITLKNRVNNRFPDIYIADMRLEMARGNRSIFSKPLFDAIAENVEHGRQTILFMNRRGHSTFVSCRSCGYVLSCESCSVNLTYHIYDDFLLCHYCGRRETPPQICPVCGSRHIRFFGAGTQKIEEEIKRFFPGAVSIRMDMDTTVKKNGHEDIIRRFATGEANILIGTQMIAKGLNFPNVSVVGIMDADRAINTGDFRSAETAFQLITQVSGRAGRAGIPGRVYLQTYNPSHYSIAYAKDGDYQSFYDYEIRLRRQMNYPPFSSIFMILSTCPDEKRLITALNKLSVIMHTVNRKGFFEMLGPAPALVSKVNNNFRWRIMVKGKDDNLLKQFVFYCVDKLNKSPDTDLKEVYMNLTLNPRVFL